MRRFFLFLGAMALLSMAIVSVASARAPITAKPTKLSFGRTQLYTDSAAKTVTLTNNSTVTITVTDGTIDTGNQFRFTTSGGVHELAPGASFTNSIIFHPGISGKITSTATFTWYDGLTLEGTTVIALSGSGS